MNDPRQRAPFAHQSSSADLSSAFAQSGGLSRYAPGGGPGASSLTSPIDERSGGPSASINGGPGVAGGGAFFDPHHPYHAGSSQGPSTSSSVRAGAGARPAGPGGSSGAKFDERGYPTFGPGSGHHYHHHHHHHYSLNTPPAPSRSILPQLNLNLALPVDLNSKLLNLFNSIFGGSSSSTSGTPPDSPQPMRITPSTVQTARFVALCSLWYACSAVSSNTTKVILNAFKFPVTLTIIQFAFVAGLCWLGSRRELNWTGRLRKPTKAILLGTLPMAGFQVGGHIFSSLAISRVPVSTVHTIKALSPLFTVLAYAVLFGVSYSPATYVALLPLTVGVMLACTFDLSLSNFFGLVCAFGSTMIFVSQNIFFKKIMPSPGTAHSGESTTSPRLDKVNLLYFSSGLAFILMVPIWLYTDAFRLLDLWLAPNSYASALTASINSAAHLTSSRLIFYFCLNGVVHFAQNVLAFAILSSTSPVTYSIASLVKRIAVICMAIVWFKQAVHPVQAAGIALTGLGLYLYNGAKRDVDRGEKKVRQVEAAREGLLPSNKADQRILEGRTPSPEPLGLGFSVPSHTLNQSTITPSVPPPHYSGAPLGVGNNGYTHPPPASYQPYNASLTASTTSVRPGYIASVTPVISASATPVPQMPAPAVTLKSGYTTGIQAQMTHEPPYPSPPASTSSSPPGGTVLGLSRVDDVQPLALAAGA